MVHFAEWAKYGTLNDYFGLGVEALNIKFYFFNIIYTLAVIQRVYPSWRHNDLHLKNILVQKVNPATISYKFGRNNFVIPAIDASARFWDYDLSNCDEVKNAAILGYRNVYLGDETNDLYCPQFDLSTLFPSINARKFFAAGSDTDTFINMWVKFLDPEFKDADGQVHKVIGLIGILIAAQRNLDKIYTSYRNKDAVLTRISLDQLTPEFILLNDYYFNEFRRTDMTGIRADEYYHYP